MKEQARNSRSAGIDLTKALAICAVLLIHCTANHYACHEVGSPRWLAADFYGRSRSGPFISAPLHSMNTGTAQRLTLP